MPAIQYFESSAHLGGHRGVDDIIMAAWCEAFVNGDIAHGENPDCVS